MQVDFETQNKVIFEPVTLSKDYRFQLPTQTKEVFVEVSRNVKLNGFLFDEPKSRELVIYFQGNSKNLQNFLDNHKMVLDWGFDVLVTDYRSFGKSEGKLEGQEQLYSDAEKIYDYALGLGYKPEQIILYGYSMGTAMVSHLATVKKAKALILESPYSSIPEISWVGDKTPAYELNNAVKARKIKTPTLLIHGDKDDVITPDHSQRIYDALAAKNKKRTVLEGGGHGDLRKRPEYKQLIIDFVSSIGTTK